MNASTVCLVTESLHNQNRHYVLATKIALLCRQCNEVRPVTDLFPNGEAKLEVCEHRRPLVYRKREDIAAYDAALEVMKKRAVAASEKKKMKRPFRVRGWIPLAAIPSVPVPDPQPLIVETPEEKKQRLWREDCERESQRVQAVRAANLEAERQRQLREQQQVERKRREGETQTREILIDAVIEKYSNLVNLEEKQDVLQAFLNGNRHQYTAELLEIMFAELVAQKQQAAQKRISELRDQCDDHEWRQIEDILVKHAHQFDPMEIFDGRAHELIWHRLNHF